MERLRLLAMIREKPKNETHWAFQCNRTDMCFTA